MPDKVNQARCSMTYPASPNNTGQSPRFQLNAVQLWAGGIATAIVAALIALVGILICRWLFGIPILAPGRAGAWGNAHTGEYVLAVGIITLVATAVMSLLILGTPSPGLFFGWLIALATLVAVVYPFSTGAPLGQKAATAVVDLVIGIAVGSLLGAVATHSIHRGLPPRDYRDGRDGRSPYGPDATRPTYPSSRTPEGWR
jgi:hypothetical protein